MHTSRSLMLAFSLAVFFAVLPSWIAPPAVAQQASTISLPAPQTDIGKPLMQALMLRQSSRSFDARPLPLQELSNLLWAAYGINRPGSGKRTAPSAVNWQDIDLYVALPEGLYLYEAQGHHLTPVVAKDLRKETGKQDFVGEAPLNLVYVDDQSRMKGGSMEDKSLYGGANAAFIAENVYLYCASQGLATVVRAMIDRPVLSVAMKLRPEQKIILAQSVGYPR